MIVAAETVVVLVAEAAIVADGPFPAADGKVNPAPDARPAADNEARGMRGARAARSNNGVPLVADPTHSAHALPTANAATPAHNDGSRSIARRTAIAAGSNLIAPEATAIAKPTAAIPATHAIRATSATREIVAPIAIEIEIARTGAVAVTGMAASTVAATTGDARPTVSAAIGIEIGIAVTSRSATDGGIASEA